MDIVPKIDEEKCKRLGRYLAMTESIMGQEALRERNVFFAGLDPENPAVRAVFKHKRDTTEAINFIERIPGIDSCDFTTEFDKLDPSVAQEVHFLSKRYSFVSFSLIKDTFAHMCSSFLPDSYEDHGGFFNSENHKGVQKLEYDRDGKPKEITSQKLSREEMMQRLDKKPREEAFQIFRFLTQDGVIGGVNMQSRFDHRETDTCLDKAPWSVYIPQMTYYFTYEDLKRMTNLDVHLSKTIVAKSNEGIGYNSIDKRFKIVDEHVEQITKLKPFIQRNDLFKKAQIITDITSPTVLETIKDNLLFVLPRILVIAGPDLVHSQTNGLLQGTAGLLATSFGSFLCGNYGYPCIDSFNSDVGKLSEWFGPYNHTRINKGLGFFWTGTLHYICTALAQKLWSFGTMPWKMVGVTIHGVRLLASLLVAIGDSNQYDNPFKRSNKEGVPFTLGDLVSGPKFTAKE